MRGSRTSRRWWRRSSWKCRARLPKAIGGSGGDLAGEWIDAAVQGYGRDVDGGEGYVFEGLGDVGRDGAFDVDDVAGCVEQGKTFQALLPADMPVYLAGGGFVAGEAGVDWMRSSASEPRR